MCGPNSSKVFPEKAQTSFEHTFFQRFSTLNVYARVVACYLMMLSRGESMKSQKLLDLGTTALRKQKYQSAKKHFARALELLDECDAPDIAIKSTFQFGMACLMLGQTEEAEEAFRKVLRFIEGAEETYPVIFVGACNNLANAIERKGNRQEAIDLLLQAVRKVQTFVLVQPVFAILYCRAAELKADGGHFWEAESLFRQAIELQVESHGRDHDDTQSMVADLVLLLREQGRTDDAITAIELYGENRFTAFARSLQSATHR
jgi:tetratricopeptide (TPR) repeat protein